MTGNTRNVPELADLRIELQQMEATMGRITMDTRDLQHLVSLLPNSSDEYIRVRHRFLDTHRRQGNALPETDTPGEYLPAPIHEESIYNIGDANTDAGLCLSNLRRLCQHCSLEHSGITED